MTTVARLTDEVIDERPVNEQAFMGIRYIAADGVRLARGLLDNGATKADLVKIFMRHVSNELPQVARDNIKAAIPHAIQFMVDNPEAGAVVWLDNGGWNWADK